ncbi:BnaC09g53360D [Brassica napus]|uniref:BnaC09g53360D protein n=1 Tax=Brassica napus TaxID=3708 RepID=A0A078IS99_BRANA|nr:BnaC09g53360D [Brassica napus]
MWDLVCYLAFNVGLGLTSLILPLKPRTTHFVSFPLANHLGALSHLRHSTPLVARSSSSSANLQVMFDASVPATIDNGCLKIPLQGKEGAFSSPTVEKQRFTRHVPVKSILCRPDGGAGLAGQKVLIFGWVRTARLQGKGSFAFLEVNDGSCPAYLQVIVDASLSDDLSKLIAKGTCVVVDGCLKLPPQGTKQKIELKVEEVVSVGTVDQVTYPFPKNKPSPEHLRKYLHLRARTSLIASVARIRNALAFCDTLFLSVTKFPLRQGSNLAYAYSLRATLVLLAFWIVEPELALADLKEDMDCAEAYVRYMCTWLLDNCYDDLEVMAKNVDDGCIDRLKLVASTPFVRVTYTDAIELLKEAVAQGETFENQVEWGIDLASEHERYLTEVVFQKPVIVYNYPKGIKAFYMRVNDDGKTVAAMDVLVPKNSLVGAKEKNGMNRLEEIGLPVEPYEWYLDLRRHGTVKHSGFGLGLERMVLFATGMDNIRDVIPFPRYPGRADL